MTPFLWSCLLTAIGITGWFLVGRKNWRGWAISLGAQVLWITYAIVTAQWGFLASAVLYGSVAAKNLRSWYRADWLIRHEPADLTRAVRTASEIQASVSQMAPWAAQAVVQASVRLATAVDVLTDHRLAYDPTRCLGCSWQPENVAPAYTIEDQHQAHVERKVFEGIQLAGIEAPAWA